MVLAVGALANQMAFLRSPGQSDGYSALAKQMAPRPPTAKTIKFRVLYISPTPHLHPLFWLQCNTFLVVFTKNELRRYRVGKAIF